MFIKTKNGDIVYCRCDGGEVDSSLGKKATKAEVTAYAKSNWSFLKKSAQILGDYLGEEQYAKMRDEFLANWSKEQKKAQSA